MSDHRPCGPLAVIDYPHYDVHPTTGATLDRVPLGDGVTSCSFMLDIPGWSQHSRPLIPLEVL